MQSSPAIRRRNWIRGGLLPLCLAWALSGAWLRGELANSCATIAALQERGPAAFAEGERVRVERSWVGGGGEPAEYAWASASKAAADGVLVLRPEGLRDGAPGRWRRVLDEPGSCDVRWWGARGDGAGDDTAAIQAAVAALRSDAPKRVLRFPEGIYRITDTITLAARAPEGIVLRGAGGATLRADPAAGWEGKAMIRLGNSRWVRLENLQLRGPGGAAALGSIGVWHNDLCVGTFIEGCDFRDLDTAILGGTPGRDFNAEQVHIEDCTATGCSWFVRVINTQSRAWSIRNCSASTRVSVDSSNWITVEDCLFSTRGDGPRLRPEQHAVRVAAVDGARVRLEDGSGLHPGDNLLVPGRPGGQNAEDRASGDYLQVYEILRREEEWLVLDSPLPTSLVGAEGRAGLLAKNFALGMGGSIRNVWCEPYARPAGMLLYARRGWPGAASVEMRQVHYNWYYGDDSTFEAQIPFIQARQSLEVSQSAFANGRRLWLLASGAQAVFRNCSFSSNPRIISPDSFYWSDARVRFENCSFQDLAQAAGGSLPVGRSASPTGYGMEAWAGKGGRFLEPEASDRPRRHGVPGEFVFAAGPRGGDRILGWRESGDAAAGASRRLGAPSPEATASCDGGRRVSVSGSPRQFARGQRLLLNGVEADILAVRREAGGLWLILDRETGSYADEPVYNLDPTWVSFGRQAAFGRPETALDQYFRVGDKLYNPAGEAGDPAEWYCVEAGWVARPWAAGVAVSPERCYLAPSGEVYRPVSGGVCGNKAPRHESGDASDGSVVWRHLGRGPARFEVLAQVGFRRVDAAPGGKVRPRYVGETVFDAQARRWWKSFGSGEADWAPAAP